MEIPSRVYRPRDPRKTSLYGLLDSLYERVKGVWDERFEPSYGFWRGLVEEAVERYLCRRKNGGIVIAREGLTMQEFIGMPEGIPRDLLDKAEWRTPRSSWARPRTPRNAASTTPITKWGCPRSGGPAGLAREGAESVGRWRTRVIHAAVTGLRARRTD